MKKLNADEQFAHINNGYFYRGMVINTFTTLERTIEKHLTEYFITNKKKKNGFYSIILDRMTFEAKRTALKAIVDQKSRNDNFIKTKNNSYPHGKLFDEMRILQDQRNSFAHFTIMIPNDENGMVIGLADMRDSFKPKWYSEEDISNINERILKAASELDKIFKK